MSMSTYTIIDTSPTVYNDPVKGVINGVLVRYRMDKYNEVHEVRVPNLDVNSVKTAIEAAVNQRDALDALGKK